MDVKHGQFQANASRNSWGLVFAENAENLGLCRFYNLGVTFSNNLTMRTWGVPVHHCSRLIPSYLYDESWTRNCISKVHTLQPHYNARRYSARSVITRIWRWIPLNIDGVILQSPDILLTLRVLCQHTLRFINWWVFLSYKIVACCFQTHVIYDCPTWSAIQFITMHFMPFRRCISL